MDERQILHAALMDLWKRDNCPSSRTLERRIKDGHKGTGPSHMTIYNLLKGYAVPTWHTLAAIVESMDGDADYFRRAWIAMRMAEGASAETPDRKMRPKDQILLALDRLNERLDRIEKLMEER